MGLLMSFTNYDGFNLDTVRWVGLENYARVFEDAEALNSFKRTAAFLVVAIPGVILIQLALASLLNQPIKGRGLFRTVFYLPTLVPLVATAWIWKMAGDTDGLINQVIGFFTGESTTQWLVEHPTDILRLLVFWFWAGTGMVIFLAALQGIPTELREAAMIDGAGTFQTTRRVVLPLLTPAIFFQLVYTTYNGFQIYQEPILLNPGLSPLVNPVQPDNRMLVVKAFSEAFVNQRFGYSAALLWILFVLVLLTTLVIFATARYWVYYERPGKARG
jgi:multiple sugar transport system permease protein